MINVTFINPPNVPFSSKGILIEPIDTLGLATYIQSLGMNASILDMDVKQMLADSLEHYFLSKWPEFIVIVFDYHIPLHNAGANSEITKIIQKAHDNHCLVVLGGKAATFYDLEQLANLGADIYIKYDMENSLEKIFSFNSNDLRFLYNRLKHESFIRFNSKDNSSIITLHHINKKDAIQYQNKKDVNNKLNNQISHKPLLDSLPIADRNLIDLNDYIDVRTILSSRGCNLKCTFCHVPSFWGNWQGKSPHIVVDEIEMLVNQFNSKKILFLDDNAMVQPKRMLEISKEIVKRNIKVTMGCLGTIVSYHQETIEKMYEAGFRWIHYGAESGDDTQLKNMGKRTTSEKTMQVVEKTRNAGFRVRTSWVLDMPDLTEEGLLQTERMIIEHGAEEIRLHFLTLRLGSLLFEQYGLETPQYIHNSQPNLNISTVSSEAIERSVTRIISALQSKGYTLVKNPNDFVDIEKLQAKNQSLKIVSLCPLRYGLGWTL